MGYYTTAERVQARCKRLPPFSAATVVRIDEVEDLINEHEGELNLALRLRGFDVPITSPSDLLAAAQKAVTEGVSAAVLKAWFQDASGPNSEASWSTWERRWQKFLDWIRDDSNSLTAIAVAGSGGGGVASYQDYDDDCPPSTVRGRSGRPAFTMGMEW